MNNLHHQYLAADILFGVGIVSAGAALVLIFTRGSAPPNQAATRVEPLLGVGGIGVRGEY